MSRTSGVGAIKGNRAGEAAWPSERLTARCNPARTLYGEPEASDCPHANSKLPLIGICERHGERGDGGGGGAGGGGGLMIIAGLGDRPSCTTPDGVSRVGGGVGSFAMIILQCLV